MKKLQALYGWLDNRTGCQKLLHEALYENVPGGSRWRYVWGSTLSFTFMVQVITGIFLWMAYSPSSQTAWESVNYIEHEMWGGWLLRGIHHFTAQAMTVLLVLHLLQVVIDGAYKAPREINFFFGMVLLLLVLGLSLTGYLLPWDQLSFWAITVGTNIASYAPGFGEQVRTILLGGNEVGQNALLRFYALHIIVIPLILIGLISLHLWRVRKDGGLAAQGIPEDRLEITPPQESGTA